MEPPTSNSPRGDFKFHLDGEKLRGDFAIVRTKRGKGNEWLLLKKKDAFAEPGWDHRRPRPKRQKRPHAGRNRARSPASASNDGAHRPETAVRIFAPMLAQIGKGTPPSSDDWLFEIKWDGVRALCLHRTTADCAWFPATATAWIANILSCPSSPHHVNAKHRDPRRRNRRAR